MGARLLEHWRGFPLILKAAAVTLALVVLISFALWARTSRDFEACDRLAELDQAGDTSSPAYESAYTRCVGISPDEVRNN